MQLKGLVTLITGGSAFVWKEKNHKKLMSGEEQNCSSDMVRNGLCTEIQATPQLQLELFVLQRLLWFYGKSNIDRYYVWYLKH